MYHLSINMKGIPVEDSIKTRAPKGREGWRSVSIPTPIYAKLAEISEKRGESVSLVVRKWLSQCIAKAN